MTLTPTNLGLAGALACIVGALCQAAQRPKPRAAMLAFLVGLSLVVAGLLAFVDPRLFQ